MPQSNADVSAMVSHVTPTGVVGRTIVKTRALVWEIMIQRLPTRPIWVMKEKPLKLLLASTFSKRV